MIIEKLIQNLKFVQFFLLILIPLALISGPFLSDLFVSLIAFIFLILSIKERQYFYYKNIFSYIFFIWCLYLIINSLFSKNPFLSLESSLFYWRFGIFALAVWYVINNNESFFK